jgi:tetratricopeptide (TPR) repeat protein
VSELREANAESGTGGDARRFQASMNPDIDAPPASSVEADVDRIRELVQHKEFAPALAAAAVLRASEPKNRDLLYLIAVSQRYLGQIQDALATLMRLEELHPQFSRLYQERGYCYVSLRSAQQAIEAFEHAVNLNAALPGSWNKLQVLYEMVGRAEEAGTAVAHVRKLATLPTEIVTATGMFAEGDVADAERITRQFLLTHGDHVEAMRLLARIAMKLDVMDDAELLLGGVLRLAPDYNAARHEYAMVLLRRHKHVRARAEIERLLAADPQDRAYRATYAAIWMGLGDHDKALPLYDKLLAETPSAPDLHLSVAHALKTLGRQQDAIDAYRRAAAVDPCYGEAYWSLANLKTYRFTDEELVRMRAAEAAPRIDLINRYHLCFALGKGLEDRGEYREAFLYYERGNQLKLAECRYRPEITEHNVQLLMKACTRDFLDARRGAGSDSEAPIFIVGLPRAGSTLLEQILASHSEVEGTMELADIPRIVQQLQGPDHVDSYARYLKRLGDLTPAELRATGEKYLADTEIYRTAKRRLFIDKNPNNFRNIGIIHVILPNAKIIDARRNAMDCCFGNFKQLFAQGQQFTYSLDHIARYYSSYIKLMGHWDEVLPGKVLRMQYEDVVEDLEGSVRRMLGFCGLRFEAACLEFHNTDRRVHTASSEQVRRPINRDGIGQWRNFEPWLGELRHRLGTFTNS